MRLKLALGLAAALGGCATPRADTTAAGAPVQVKIIGFNDFHGNLEPPRTTVAATVEGASEPVRVPAGGAA
jgi:5'-nucleotidase